MNLAEQAASAALPNLVDTNPVPDFNTAAPAPAVNAEQAALAKKAREDKATFGTYYGASLRQDGFIMGAIANLAGPNTVDPDFIATDPKNWKMLTEGIPAEYHSAFYDATSLNQAYYRRTLIEDKLKDQQTLGDLGTLGQTLRFVGGFVSPDGLLMNLVSMGAGNIVSGGSALYRANAAVRMAAALPNGPARTTALLEATKGLEAATAAASTAKGVATMAASGMAQNALYEGLRQKYGFENDTAGILHASLMGLAFTTPFAGVHALGMARLRKVAGVERDLLQVIQRANDHPDIPLSAEEHRVIEQADAAHAYHKGVEQGTIDPVTTPHPFDAELGAQLHAEVAAHARARADAILAEMFPDKAPADVGAPTPAPVELTPKQKLFLARKAKEEVDLWDSQNRDLLGDVPQPGQGLPPEPLPLSRLTHDEKLTAKAAILQRLTERARREPDLLSALDNAPEPGPAAPSEAPKAPANVTSLVDVRQRLNTLKGLDSEMRQEMAATLAEVERKIGQGRLTAARVDEALSHAEWDPDSIIDSLHGLLGSLDGPTTAIPGRLPEGFTFGNDSVGAARVGALTTDQLFVGIDPVYMRGGRLDISATLNRSANPVVQEFGWMMVKDAIGNGQAQGWSASEAKSNLVRRVGGEYHVTEMQAMQAAQQKLGLTRWNREAKFSEIRAAATKVARGETVPPELAAVAAEIQTIASAQQKLYTRMLDEMRKAGVRGAEEVPDNLNYVNRVWRSDNISAAIQKHGDALFEMIGNALRTPVPAGHVGPMPRLSPAERVKTAKSFMSAIQRLQYSSAGQNLDLLARDMGTLRRELEHAKLTPDEIDAIVTHLFEVKHMSGDAGNAPNLKFRFKLDETHAEVMPDGTRVGISDLLENDSRVLVDRYMQTMAGQVAAAQKGLASRADVDAWLRNADRWHEENPGRMTPQQLADGKQLMSDMYDHLVGRPMSTQSFSKADRWVRAMQAYGRSALLGQLGIAAAGELKNSIAIAGLRAALDQLPTFRATIAAMKRGYVASDKLAQSIHEFWGFASEYASTYARKHEAEDFAVDQGLSKFERFSAGASHVVDTISGNRFFTSATREMSARMMIQKYANIAAGSAKLTNKLRDRMVANGVPEGQIQRVLADLQQFTKRDGRRVTELDWEGWAQHDPNTLSSFQLLVERSVRDGIQSHDIGETMPWMHTTVGRIFGELRTFNLAGHAKQTLKNLHHRDATAMSAVMLSIVGESLGYALQVSINTPNAEDRAKRLSLENIARAVAARSNLMGMAAFPLDFASRIATGQPLGSTNNTDNRNFLVPPTVGLMQKALTGAVGLGQHLNPFLQDTWTRDEGRGLAGALPGGNTYFVRPFISWATHDMAKKEAP